jgi:predicted Holliday junction resolvase-like endonuclease
MPLRKGHMLIWGSIVVMGTVIFLEFQHIHMLEAEIAKLQSNIDLQHSNVMDTVEGLHRQVNDVQQTVIQLQNSEIVNHANLHNIAQTHTQVNIKPKVDHQSIWDSIKGWVNAEPVKPAIPFEIVP